MTMATQLLLGSLYLSITALFHVGMVAASLSVFPRLSKIVPNHRTLFHNFALLGFALLVIVVSHTLSIWFWAALYFQAGAFEDIATSFYFATVTYTTLGYGDLVLGPGLRIFATFGAITGLLTFGISTAFLIGMIGRLIPMRFNDPD
jgi:hypothetical protein